MFVTWKKLHYVEHIFQIIGNILKLCQSFFVIYKNLLYRFPKFDASRCQWAVMPRPGFAHFRKNTPQRQTMDTPASSLKL